MTGYHRWILLTIVLAALPSFFHLPWWVAVIACAGGVLHYAGSWREGWYGRGAGIVLLCLTALGIWLSFPGWFSGDAILSFFIAVVFLKWGEAKNRRDYLLLIFAAMILAAVGALYWESILSMLHMFLVALALVTSLVAISAGEMRPGLRFVLRRAGGLFLLGLPLMAVLFLAFPRIPGPLWDIGLAFGLPVKALMEQGRSDHGDIKKLEPGAVQQNRKSSGNVLVAEFEGAIPSKSRLYWRGPVFWDFDGESWTLPDDWNNRARLLRGSIKSVKQLKRELISGKDPVRYSLRVMANGGRWLYGLELPASPGPEAFISEDFQLLSIRKLIGREPKLDLSAFLEYRVGAQLRDTQRSRALAWPEGTNPRLLALGRELAEKYNTTGDIVSNGLGLLMNAGYSFDSLHVAVPGPDMYDRYFFDEKRGGVQLLAGSFAMLMRAAGVPSRLVSGYRGGSLIALTKFVMVKHGDAHVWLEIWEDDQGWRRVEPKDIVLPPGKKDMARQEKEKEQTELAVKVKKEDLEQVLPEPDSSTDEKKKEKTAVESDSRQDNREKTSILDGFFAKIKKTYSEFSKMIGGVEKWVIDYSPDRQVELLTNVGVEKGTWQNLMAIAMSGGGALLGIYLSVAWWRGRQRIDKVGKVWRKFCDRMIKLGVKKKEHECPRDFCIRVCEEQPALAVVVKDISGRYCAIRYGNETTPDAVRQLLRQVERFVSMT